jgi:nucleotide-binding universal stress UspA family protein
MLDHLLLPLDGSQLAECVLPHAAAVAQTFEARITVLGVLEDQAVAGQTRSVDPMNWHIRRAEYRAYLESVAARFKVLGITCEADLLEGPPAERVIAYAHEHGIDLVVLSSHGRSGLSGWNISSVVQKIVLRIYRPVMIIRAYTPTVAELDELHYQRLLVPLDGTQRAEAVLPWASRLAVKQAARLLLVQVVRQPDMPRHVPLTPEEQDLLEQIVERNRLEGEKYLDQLKARWPGTIETRLLVSPRIATALHEVAEQEQVDLILTSAHSYSADTRWPYGSEVVGFLAYGNSALLIMPDVPPETLEQSKAEAAAQSYGGR